MREWDDVGSLQVVFVRRGLLDQRRDGDRPGHLIKRLVLVGRNGRRKVTGSDVDVAVLCGSGPGEGGEIVEKGLRFGHAIDLGHGGCSRCE